MRSAVRPAGAGPLALARPLSPRAVPSCGAVQWRTLRAEGGRVGADRATDRASAWASDSGRRCRGVRRPSMQGPAYRRVPYHCTPERAYVLGPILRTGPREAAPVGAPGRHGWATGRVRGGLLCAPWRRLTRPPPPPRAHRDRRPGLGDGVRRPQYRAAVVDLLGALAYGELAAFERLAEDAKLAPTLEDKAELAKMASAEFHHFEQLRDRLAAIDVRADGGHGAVRRGAGRVPPPDRALRLAGGPGQGVRRRFDRLRLLPRGRGPARLRHPRPGAAGAGRHRPRHASRSRRCGRPSRPSRGSAAGSRCGRGG